MRILHRKRGKIAENRALIDVNRRYFGGLIADFLRLIDVNTGGLGLKKGQGILHLICCLVSLENPVSRGAV